MKKCLSFFIITLLFISYAHAQEPQNNEVIENLIEELTEAAEAEIDFSTLYDDLLFYIENPLNLNTATRDDLERLQFLNDFQIEGLLKYQRTAGEMQTIYELLLVDGFDKADIKHLIPFVTVNKKEDTYKPTVKQILKYGRNTLFLRNQFVIEEPAGYSSLTEPDKRYDGNRMRYYTRYKFDYKRKIQFGFTAEKDPGEAFRFDDQVKGFDYYTGHLQIKNVGIFKSINIGDYQTKFGQGLVAWSGYGTRKSSYVLDIRKKHDGLRKYSSTDENKFFRGAGATIRVFNTDITAFVSYKNIDAAIELDTLTDEEISTSYQTTGLHRKASEMLSRKQISEFVYGANATYRSTNFRIGATYINYEFGIPLEKDPKVYSQFEFSGDQNSNYSIDYQYNWRNFYFFGEEAMSQNGGYALLNSMLVHLAPQMSLALLHRRYTPDYQAYYASGFGEKSNTNNENGMYIGTEIHPYRNWKVSAYYDAFSFPWLRYRLHAPSSGVDYFVQTDYNPSRYIEMYVRYKDETGNENQSDESTGIEDVVSTRKQQLRYHISYSLSRELVLKSRIELALYRKENLPDETGFMMYQDINYHPKAIPLTTSFRFAVFDADYNARSYAYENDILYAFSVPSYSGRGFRTYLTLKYTLIDSFADIWLRYALFHYTDRDVIGSGWDEIDGSNKSEVKIQLRLKF